MKKIAVLTCLEATAVCSGAACFNAINGRRAFFSDYADEAVEIVAFFHCNGCDADYDNDKEYIEKIERVCSQQPDVIHVGKCTYYKGNMCPTIQRMIDYFEQKDIKIVIGTH